MEKGRINTDFADAFKLRTRKQAAEVIKYLKAIPGNSEIYVIKNQLIKAVTSVAANYRAACRVKSKPDFIAKLVHEEADEVLFWFEILKDLEYNGDEIRKLMDESEEILRIVAKSISTSGSNYYQKN